MNTKKGENLEASFICAGNRTQKCDLWALGFSDFFRLQLKGRASLDDVSYDFTYKKFRFVTVKMYLDMLHSIDCEDIALDVLVELLKFLRCDGMQGQFCFCLTVAFNL